MKSKKALEQRSYSFDVRANEENGTAILSGRPIVYNSLTDLGWFDEIIDAGALDETDLKDVRFLVNHNTDMIPLARSRRNNDNSTMHLTADSEGLSLDWVKLDTENNADARALYSAVQRGDLSSMSFMFSIDGETWENLDSDHPTRHITKIGTVVEVSVVTFPAYSETEINARNAQALESARAALEKAKEQRDLKAVDTDKSNELELLKIKTLILGG